MQTKVLTSDFCSPIINRMMAKSKIKDIANINAGYTFRKAIKASPEGNIFVLQARDINSKEYFCNADSLTRTTLEIPRSNSYLNYNDVLLTSRGSGAGSFKSTVFKAYDKNVVASSSMIIIHIKNSNILPEYFSLFFSSIDGQKLLSSILSGSHIKTILRKDLENLKIPIPPIGKQKAIVALYENINRQEKISERIIQTKNLILSASIKSLITN